MPFNDQLDRNALLEILKSVKPREARAYATANGWVRKREDFGGLAVFDHSEKELTQLLIPIESSANDFPLRMLDVVQRVSEFENRPVSEITNDLLNPDADTVRFRISDPSVSTDLSLLKGIEVLAGARKSLLSAAHSVLAPVTYHPRLSRREARDFVEQCRLKQTEHGSFVVAVACPLDAVDADGLLDGVDSFTRQTTNALMESLSRMESKIEADEEASLGVVENGEVPVSANLCDAIAKLQPPTERGFVEVSTTWASTTPNQKLSQREVVRFSEDHFNVIRDVGSRLRPSHKAEVASFAGQVETLNGDLNDAGRRYGEVVLDLLVENELVRTRVELDADDYSKADAAHMKGTPVIVTGELHRGRRTHRLSSVTKFDGVDAASNLSKEQRDQQQ